MRTKFWVGILLGVFAVSATAQGVSDGERLFRDAVVKKQRVIRGFNSAHEIRFHWDGSAVAGEAPQVRTLGVLIAKSVKVKGSKVQIEGDRMTLMRKEDGTLMLFGQKDPVKVDVDLTGADMATLLPQLANVLFYPDYDSALADLPGKYKTMLPAKLARREVGPAQTPAGKRCDCADTDSSCLDSKNLIGMEHPKVSHMVEPEFSDSARQMKFSGEVQVGIGVDKSGIPNDLWIMRPAGMGLDEKAGEAVAQYRFSPATCHGNPVETTLYIDVNFKIF